MKSIIFCKVKQCDLALEVLVTAIDALRHFKQDNYSSMGGDGGCKVGEVRAGTTSLIPDHKFWFEYIGFNTTVLYIFYPWRRNNQKTCTHHTSYRMIVTLQYFPTQDQTATGTVLTHNYHSDVVTVTTHTEESSTMMTCADQKCPIICMTRLKDHSHTVMTKKDHTIMTHWLVRNSFLPLMNDVLWVS